MSQEEVSALSSVASALIVSLFLAYFYSAKSVVPVRLLGVSVSVIATSAICMVVRNIFEFGVFISVVFSMAIAGLIYRAFEQRWSHIK